MQDLISFLIEPLVDDLKKVDIQKNQEGDNIQFTISVPKEHIAKVIGKNGKMIKAIKNLTKIRSIKENLFTSLEIVES